MNLNQDKPHQRIVKLTNEIITLSEQHDSIRNATVLSLQEVLSKLKQLLNEESEPKHKPSVLMRSNSGTSGKALRPPSRLSPLERHNDVAVQDDHHQH